MIYLELFLGFLLVGCFAFGGAYGAIPLIRDVVMHFGWMEEDMLTNMIAVSESTPGPIMVNLATYIGSVQGGILGAAIATISVILPSFCIVLLLMLILKKALKNPYFQSVLQGLKPCIIGIILATGVYLVLKSFLKDLSSPVFDFDSFRFMVVIAAIFFGSRLFMKKGISPIFLILVSGVLGIFMFGLS